MDRFAYGHAQYAAALQEHGAPIWLPHSKSWILKCPIPGADAFDGRGLYPLLVCQDWDALPQDLAGLDQGLVSLAAVLDPFGDYYPEQMQAVFGDVFNHFKDHYVIDLQAGGPSAHTSHHQRKIRKALAVVDVAFCEKPQDYIEPWVALYGGLVARHNIQGMAAFSPLSLAQQALTPGMEMFRAAYRGETVGIALFAISGPVAHYHLAAYSQQGYDLGASYALFDHVIRRYRQMLKWLNLGGGAGLQVDKADGLARFKAGWATGRRPAYFGGKIFDAARYQALAASTHLPGSFFPAYRRPAT